MSDCDKTVDHPTSLNNGGGRNRHDPADEQSTPHAKQRKCRRFWGVLDHWSLPSFFQLLKYLVAEGRDFAILCHTFG
ncbi:unnamed protein product [Coregonus sp. 'balchen']|nr:unnamed protein product [Coregonus sp. 'balchen']